MASNIFQFTFDRPNSFFGLIQSLKEESQTRNKIDTEDNEALYITNTSFSQMAEKTKTENMRKDKLEDLEAPLDTENDLGLTIDYPNINNVSSSLHIKGFSNAKEYFLIELIELGIPKDVVRRARFSQEGLECFIDNLEIIPCAELVYKLNGLDFGGDKLKCEGIIRPRQLVEVTGTEPSNSGEHEDNEHVQENGEETSGLTSNEDEDTYIDKNGQEVCNESNTPFIAKVKQLINRLKPRKIDDRFPKLVENETIVQMEEDEVHARSKDNKKEENMNNEIETSFQMKSQLFDDRDGEDSQNNLYCDDKADEKIEEEILPLIANDDISIQAGAE